MARVTLAYPYGKHDAGVTVNLTNAEAQRLIRDGAARPATTDAPADKPAKRTKKTSPRRKPTTTSGSSRDAKE